MRESLPSQLLDRDQWVCWSETYVDERDEITKVPYNPLTGKRALSTEPSTWADFDLAHGLVELGEYDGVGFMFSREDQLAGIDLDNCRNPDARETEPWAIHIMEAMDTYTEISPSGTGYHVFALAIKPDGRNRRSQVRLCESMADWKDPEIEMYDRERFFTVTGERVDGVSHAVEQRHDAYGLIHREYVADLGVETTESEPVEPIDLSEREVADGEIYNELGMPLASIRNADEKLDALLTHTEPGYSLPHDNDSASGYDYATAVKCLFWRFDRYAVADILRRYRDRAKIRDRDNYVEITVESALREIDDRYMDEMKLLKEEYDMIVDSIDDPTDVYHRDLLPSCPACGWLLGDHTRCDDDPTDRYCSTCKKPWTMQEVLGQ